MSTAGQGSSADVEALTAALLHVSTIPSSRRGTPRCWRALEQAPGGCEAELRAYAEAFVAAGERHGVDGWLLAAMAWRESRLMAGARGVAEERGILQVHPRRLEARGLAVYQDRAWLRCRREVGQCQAEVVEAAAGILARALVLCVERARGPGHDLDRGLSAYNSGRCDSARGLAYAARVLRTRDDLRATGGAA